MRTFFGGVFMKKEELKEAGINYPIKIEYYKKINEDEFVENKKFKFGINVIKTEYKPNDVSSEEKEIEYLTNDENKVNKILEILKNNQVTPIQVEDIICDFSKILF